MLLHWSWFANLPGVNNHMKKILLQHFHDPEEIYRADTGAFKRVPNLTKEALAALTDRDTSLAEKIIEDCHRGNIRLLTYRDAAYPNRLRNIPDPPMVLYYIGSLPDIDANPVIGIVGTRKPSGYGLDVAKRMGYQISCCGGLVASGMAAGIDASAMQGAMLSGGSVIGVLGCGVDVVYPPSNRQLFASALRRGCIISEYAPGTPPNRWNFPRRNRIISGLSCGVLVVEAPERSGALITASQAAEQGRDVFVVPGNIDNPACVGSNRLIRDGAIVVGCGWDVMEEYEGLFPGKVRKCDDREPAGNMAEKCPPPEEEKPASAPRRENPKTKTTKKVIDKEHSAPYSDVNDTMPKLSEEERTLVAMLKDGERLVDDMIAETGMSTGKMLSLLTMLELKGVVTRLPGKRMRLRF